MIQRHYLFDPELSRPTGFNYRLEAELRKAGVFRMAERAPDHREPDTLRFTFVLPENINPSDLARIIAIRLSVAQNLQILECGKHGRPDIVAQRNKNNNHCA